MLVSGAGIAGLAAALRLRQIGWEPLVVERAPSRRRGGYLINIPAAGHQAAQRLSLLPALHQRHVELREFVYVTAGGRRKFAVPEATVSAMLGQPHLTLLRGDLEAALYQAVHDQVEIRFGTQIQTVTGHATGVHAVLSDATTIDADLLIGADGLHSTVRAQVFGPQQHFRVELGNLLFAAFLPQHLPDGVGEHTVVRMSAPGRTAAVASLGAGRAAALFAYRSPDPARDLASGPHPALTRAYRETGWLLPELLDQLRQAESVYFDRASQVRADHWSRGRVVLLGDAAWCPPACSPGPAPRLPLPAPTCWAPRSTAIATSPPPSPHGRPSCAPRSDRGNRPAAATQPGRPQPATWEPGCVTCRCARPPCHWSPGSSSGSSGSTDDPGQAALRLPPARRRRRGRVPGPPAGHRAPQRRRPPIRRAGTRSRTPVPDSGPGATTGTGAHPAGGGQDHAA